MAQTNIERAIEQAHAAMAAHPEYALTPFYRFAIYEAFGPIGSQRRFQARGWVDILSSRYVLPVWQNVWPDDGIAERLLETAEDIVRCRSGRDVGIREWDSFWTNTASRDDEMKWQAHAEACCARQAAAQAVGWLVNQDAGCSAPMAQDDDSQFFDPMCADSALWAAAAYAGPIWERESDPARRRVFWQWWLTEAIPQALTLARFSEEG